MSQAAALTGASLPPKDPHVLLEGLSWENRNREKGKKRFLTGLRASRSWTLNGS